MMKAEDPGNRLIEMAEALGKAQKVLRFHRKKGYIMDPDLMDAVESIERATNA